MTNEDKIKFHNAIANLANKYYLISEALDDVFKELSLSSGVLTEEFAKHILNSLPARDTDEEEAAVEVFMQRFFS
jgi:hypothetical protein